MTCHRFGFSWADRLPMSFGVERLCPDVSILKGYLPTFHFPDVSFARCFICPLFHLPAVCARRFGLPHFPQASAPSQIQSSDKSEHSIGTVRTLECDDLSSLWIFLG
jgi:hypothetical protein